MPSALQATQPAFGADTLRSVTSQLPSPSPLFGGMHAASWHVRSLATTHPCTRCSMSRRWLRFIQPASCTWQHQSLSVHAQAELHHHLAPSKPLLPLESRHLLLGLQGTCISALEVCLCPHKVSVWSASSLLYRGIGDAQAAGLCPCPPAAPADAEYPTVCALHLLSCGSDTSPQVYCSFTMLSTCMLLSP